VPCGHVEVDQHFRGVYCLHPSETLINFSVTTWRYFPEDTKLHTCRHENLKSHIVFGHSEKEMHQKNVYVSRLIFRHDVNIILSFLALVH
jgi:hypothetical protein